MGSWPENVGILAIECVFPSLYVDQSELEVFNGVEKGKYVNALGQLQMGICTDREDVNSICLTVVQRLLERYKINPSDIGRLEVGTETVSDKVKSVKNVLLQLFEPYGVVDLEGLDIRSGCYGGTAALFNSVAWIESSVWNGRYAIVVAADIVASDEPTALPIGGAGAVAMLVGPNAPLVIDRGLRGTIMKHSSDSLQPKLTASGSYMEALQHTYQLYREKTQKKTNCANVITMEDFDYLLFHAPNCTIPQRAIALLTVIDFINCISKTNNCENFKNSELSEIKSAEEAIHEFSKDTFNRKTLQSLLLTSRLGNTHSASLYGSLISLLINHNIEQLAGKKICLFSYDSGISGTMYSITVAKEYNNNSKLSTMLCKLVDVKERLEKRKKLSPTDFKTILELREKAWNEKQYLSVADTNHLFSGSYYVAQVDEMQNREYKRKLN
ncbi:hypothetical protein RI129_004054 [Pyrocoelia pectoralis]|uniref:Hydroxymethylglutaryl-CoA synthase n=1 Tax=Pyrocoelia pectoralis TaxID=417401 RepID=A0AAN7ZNN7_9COLE